jgi:hypothetical protein
MADGSSLGLQTLDVPYGGPGTEDTPIVLVLHTRMAVTIRPTASFSPHLRLGGHLVFVVHSALETMAKPPIAHADARHGSIPEQP